MANGRSFSYLMKKSWWFLLFMLVFVLGYHKTGDHQTYWTFKDEVRLQGPLDQDDERVLSILRKKYLRSPSIKSYNLSTDEIYKVQKQRYSWGVIHSHLKTLFQNQSNGFFVEAGALDGEFLSNSLWLEMSLNWTGLLVEPDPTNYRELLTKNRKSWSSNVCLSPKPFPKQITFVSRQKRPNLGTSLPKWTLKGASHEEGYTVSPIYDKLFASTMSDFIKVQCFPLYSFLLALNKSTVDLLSLDTQGSEMDIIRTIPFHKIKVKVIVVEHYVSKHSNDADFVGYFQKRGYKLINCLGEPDYIFVLKEDARWKNLKDLKTCT